MRSASYGDIQFLRSDIAFQTLKTPGLGSRLKVVSCRPKARIVKDSPDQLFSSFGKQFFLAHR